MRILTTAVAAAMAVSGITLGLAPSASAAELRINACGGVSHHAQVGDVITVYGDSADNCEFTNGRRHPIASTSDWVEVSSGTVTAYQTTFLAADAWVLTHSAADSPCIVAVLGPEADTSAPYFLESLVTFGLPLCGFAPAGVETQQLLVHEAIGLIGECHAQHGWAASWQEWANEGKGGPVCQRTLLYDDGTGAWVIGAWSPQANKWVPSTEATIA